MSFSLSFLGIVIELWGFGRSICCRIYVECVVCLAVNVLNSILETVGV